MRRVSVSSLKPGMKVARTIYGNVGEALLKNGVKLTTVYIKKLVKHNIPFVYIDDGLLPDVVVEDVIAQETRIAAARQVKNILLDTKESGRLVIEPQAIYGTVNQFTGELLGEESLMLNLATCAAKTIIPLPTR